MSWLQKDTMKRPIPLAPSRHRSLLPCELCCGLWLSERSFLRRFPSGVNRFTGPLNGQESWCVPVYQEEGKHFPAASEK